MSISKYLKSVEITLSGENFAAQTEALINSLVPILVNQALLSNRVFRDGEIKDLAKQYSEQQLKLVCKKLGISDKEVGE